MRAWLAQLTAGVLAAVATLGCASKSSLVSQEDVPELAAALSATRAHANHTVLVPTEGESGPTARIAIHHHGRVALKAELDAARDGGRRHGVDRRARHVAKIDAPHVERQLLAFRWTAVATRHRDHAAHRISPRVVPRIGPTSLDEPWCYLKIWFSSSSPCLRCLNRIGLHPPPTRRWCES